MVECAFTWSECSKNPGHTDFIPAPEFCLDHLPRWCSDPSVVECVRTIAALTVRLRVSYTSWSRPDGYTFSKHRGSGILHTGSGWVRKIQPGSGPCRCPECRRSSFPRQDWYEVHLETACHVVYNTEEAQATKVDFFFDDERSKVEGWIETIHAFAATDQDEKGDICILLCATHDHDLGDILQVCVDKLRPMERFNICAVYSQIRTRHLCIIVSHPHGRPKQVTVGEEQLHMTAAADHRYFTYSTATCPGSSGAPVLFVQLSPDILNKSKFVKSNGSLISPLSQWLPADGLNQSSGLVVLSYWDNTVYPQRVVFDAC